MKSSSILQAVTAVKRELRHIAKREVGYALVWPANLLCFITYRCTSRCKTCTMWKRPAQDGELTLEEWKRVVDEASRYGIDNVELFGGDALLRKDITIPLTKHIKQKGIQPDLSTNCNLLDLKTIEALDRNELATYYISMDAVGSGGDEIRGVPGTFERVVRAIDQINVVRGKRSDPQIVLVCTISRLNLECFEEILPLAEQIGANELQLEYMGEIPEESAENSLLDESRPNPYFSQPETSLLLNREQADFLKAKIDEMKARAVASSVNLRTTDIDVLSVEDLIRGQFPAKRCYVCRHWITIDPQGNILACPFFETYPLGNVRDEPLNSIWGNARHRRFCKVQRDGEIQICEYCSLNPTRNYTLSEGVWRKWQGLHQKRQLRKQASSSVAKA